MKLTSKTAGIGVMAVAALMLAGAGIADTQGMMGDGMGGFMRGHMGGRMGAMMGPMFDIAALDTDKDGKISKAELEAHHAARLAEVDANNDGKLSAEELASMQIKAMTERANQMAARMVERLDTDGDGLLSAAELVTPPMPDRMFDRIDANGDGFIDQAEIDAARAWMQERMGDGQGRGHRFHRGGDGQDGGWMMDDDQN